MAEAQSCIGEVCIGVGSWADWFSGTMSALAVIAALAGYFVADWYRRRDRRAEDVSTAQMVGLKLFKVMNSSNDIHRHLSSKYNGPPLIDGNAEPALWNTIDPLIGLQIDEAIRLDSAEMGLLVRLNEMTFLTELMLAISRYESMVLSMQEYQVGKNAIHQMTPPPVDMEGRIGRHVLTREEYMKILPYTVAIEHLIRSIKEMAEENVQKLETLSQKFHPMMKSHYKSERFIDFLPIIPK